MSEPVPVDRRGRTRDEYRDPVVPPAPPVQEASIGGGILGALKGIARGFGSVFGQAATPIQYQQTISPAASGVQTQAAETLSKPITVPASWYDQHVWRPWSQFETSALATIGTELKAAQSGDFYNPVDIWKKAWNEADRATSRPLTPGQAAFFVFENLPVVKQVTQTFGVRSGVEDLLSPEQRVKYESNPVLKYTTGSLDFSNNIFADPSVLFLGGLGKARMAITSRAISPTRGIFATAKQAQEFARVAQARTTAERAVVEAHARVSNASVGIADVTNQIRQTQLQIDDLAASGGFVDPSLTAHMDDLIAQRTQLEADRAAFIDQKIKADADLADVKAQYIPRADAGFQQFVDAVHDYDLTPHQIFNHYTIQRFGTEAGKIASIIDATKRTGDKAITMDVLNAMTGNIDSLARLYDQAPFIHEMIRRVHGDLDFMHAQLQAARETGGDVAEYLATNQKARARLRKELDDLLFYDRFLNETVGGEGQPLMALQRGFASAGAVTDPLRKFASVLPSPAQDAAAKFTGIIDRLPALIEDFRTGRAVSRTALQLDQSVADAVTGWRATTHQSSWLARPVVHLQWMGRRVGRENPSGWVALFGYGAEDGVREFTAFVDSVDAWKNNPELKQDFINSYITAGQRERKYRKDVRDIRADLLDKIERQAFLDTAGARNPEWLTPISEVDEAGNPLVLADMIWQEYKRKRSVHMRAVLESREVGKSNRRYAVDENGTMITSPVFDSQLEYSHPMLDIKTVEQVFKSHTDAQNVSKFYRALHDSTPSKIARMAITSSYDFFDALWRPAVLLRLGYPQRNVAEALLRSLAYFGHEVALMYPQAAESTKAWATNRYAHLNANLDSLRLWKSFEKDYAAAGGDPMVAPRTPVALPVMAKSYGQYLQTKLVEQTEMLRAMEDGHTILNDAHMKMISSDLADVKATIRELAIRKKAGEDVAESLRDARRRLKDLKTEWEERKTSLTADLIDAQKQQIDVLLQAQREFDTLMASKGLKGNRVYANEDTILIGPHMVDASFSGSGGQVFKNLVSSEGRTSYDLNLHSVMSLDAQAVIRNRWQNYNPPRILTGRTNAEIEGDIGYWAALEQHVHQLRTDTLAAKMLEAFATPGDFGEQIVDALSRGSAWMKTAEGRSYFERVKRLEEVLGAFDPNVTPEQVALMRLIDSGSGILPALGENEALIRRIAADKKRLLAPELRRELLSSEKTVPVVGQETRKLMELRDNEGWWTSIRAAYSTLVKKGFKVLGSMPEDRFVRHPFADLVYRQYMKEQLARFDEQGVKVSQEMMDRLQNAARTYATKETRRTLYTIMREKSIGSSRIAKAISPFNQAQLNTLATWSKLLWEKPEAIGYIQQIWRNIDKLGDVSIDPDTGEKYITFQIPAVAANAVSLVSPAMAEAMRIMKFWAFPKSGANVIMAGARGDNLATQLTQMFGVGTMVQIPLGWWIRNNSDIDREVFDVFGVHLPVRSILSKIVPDDQLPRGTSFVDAVKNGVAPAWLRNVMASSDGYDSYRWGSTALMIALNKKYQQDNDPTAKPKTMAQIYKEAEHEADMFMLVRTIANLSLPVIPRYETALKPYVSLLREYQNKHGMEQGFAKFVMENPSLYYVAASLSSNTSGMDSTTLAVHLAKKHSGLLDAIVGSDPKENAQFVSMVTDTLPSGEGKFDTASNLWKRGQAQFVQRKDVAGAFNDSQRAAGWVFFHDMQSQIDAALKQQGLKSVQQNPVLAYAKRVYVAQLSKAYPAWGEDYNTANKQAWLKNVKMARMVAFDPSIVKDSNNYKHMEYVRAYFQMRDWISGQLRQRTIQKLQEMGIANPNEADISGNQVTIDDTNRAGDLALMRDAYVSQLRQNAVFSQFYDRWLDSDKMTEIGKGFGQ